MSATGSFRRAGGPSYEILVSGCIAGFGVWLAGLACLVIFF